MKAYVLRAIKELDYCEVDKPVCMPGWVVVKVKAAGICSSDIPRIYEKGTYRFPTIPGHEFSGVVDSVADKQNECLVGKRVGIFPLIPCMKCESCMLHHYETCDNYDYIGSRRDGAFAEYVAVPAWNLIILPNEISFVQAAMLEPLAVALHAINQFSSLEGKNVAIIGTGMIGISAGQWALNKGASSVTIIGHSKEKQLLINHFPGLNYNYFNTDNQFDCVLEAVGKNDTIDKSISITKAYGEIVLMGNPYSDLSLSQKTYWRILRKQLCIRGTWNSSFDNSGKGEWEAAINALKNKMINTDMLVTHRFNQKQLTSGLEIMRNKSESYCKIMTIWNEE